MITKSSSQTQSLLIFVTDPVIDTCNSALSDHFFTLPDGCFEDGTNKNKINIGKCNNHPCLRADANFLESCDETKRCCQPGTVSETIVRCGQEDFKMEKVLNCTCDVCMEKAPIVKGTLFFFHHSVQKAKIEQIMIYLLTCIYMVKRYSTQQ